MPVAHSPELIAVLSAFNTPTISRPDALMRDLLLFVEDAGNMACEAGFNSIEHRADQLFIRIKRELEA